ncbi:MFS general substrate transporter [Violaceomyces palustris]|uniref:MFS general substrate transporter n=1 Tax=Violaceomyces palustris TaxID=1673888 RepID=A0ACD0NRJ3_9BASI|nr:MFS general substrate transporter [Violaceomyces palustris]
MTESGSEGRRSGSITSDEKEKVDLQNVGPTYLTQDASEIGEDRESNRVERMVTASNLENINQGLDLDEVKRVTRKVDKRLLPILGALYSIALIDRTNLSAARIAGAGVDLKLTTGSNYSIPALIFFVPYIIFELPSNLLLRKIGAAKQLGTIAFLWGSMMVAMGFVNNWQQLTVLRALVGLFEAGFFPACVLLISTWYVRKESQVRMSFFYLISVGVAGFSNILAYGLSLMEGVGGLRGWRWIFIIEGIITVLVALVAYWIIVDFPDKAVEKGFLTQSESDLVLTRIQRDRGDSEHDPLTWSKAAKYASDVKLWCYGLCFMCATMPSYAFAYFLPVIFRGMGFNVRDSFLLIAPPYIFAVIVAFSLAIVSDRIFMRAPIVITQALMTILGLGMLFAQKHRGVQLAGSFFGVAGANGNVASVLNYGQNNIQGQSKRSFVSALVVGFGGIGGIMASTVFREKDAPLYRPGLWATIGAQIFIVLCVSCLSVYFFITNKLVRSGKKVVEGKEGFLYTI